MKPTKLILISLSLSIAALVSTSPSFGQLKIERITKPESVLDTPKIQLAGTNVRVFGQIINGNSIGKSSDSCTQFHVQLEELVTWKNPDGSFHSQYEPRAEGKAQGTNNQLGCSYSLSFTDRVKISGAIRRADGAELVTTGARQFNIDVFKPGSTNSFGETTSPELGGILSYQDDRNLASEKLVDVKIEKR